MVQKFDIKRYGVLIGIALLFFIISSFKINIPLSQEWGEYSLIFKWITLKNFGGFFSYLLGIISLIIISLLVEVYYKYYSTSDNLLLASIFAVLAFSLPFRPIFDPIFIAIAMFVLVMILQCSLTHRKQKDETIFLTMFLLGVSSFFFLPLLWFFPIFLLLSIVGYESKGKLLVNAVLGFLMPFIIVFGIMAVFSKSLSLSTLLSQIWDSLINISPRFLPFKSATIIKNILLIVLIFSVLVKTLMSIRGVNVIKARYFKITVVYMLTLIVLAILFCGNLPQVWIFPFIPFSILFYAYFSEKGDMQYGKLICTFLLFIMIIERVIWIL